MTLDDAAAIYGWISISILAVLLLLPVWALFALLWHRHAIRLMLVVAAFLATIVIIPPALAAAIPGDPTASEALPPRGRAIYALAASVFIADILAAGALVATVLAMPSRQTHDPNV